MAQADVGAFLLAALAGPMLGLAWMAPDASTPTQAAVTPLSELAGRIGSGDPEVAWPAVLELGARAFDAKERKEGEALASAWRKELHESKGEDRRIVLAHALGALGKHAKPELAGLARTMAKDGSAAVRLACTLALVRQGEDGVRAALDFLEDKDLVGGALACAVFGQIGKVGARTLAGTVDEASEFRWYLLTEAALVALELAAEAPDKFLEKRANKRRGLRAPKFDNFNWFGLLPFEPSAILAFQKPCGRTEFFDPEEFELPSSMRATREHGRACDVYADALGHVVNCGLLVRQLDSEPAATFAAYRERTLRWVRTLALLMEIEAKLVPRK